MPFFGFAANFFGFDLMSTVLPRVMRFCSTLFGLLLLAPVGSGVQIGPNLGSQVISPRTCLRSVPFLLTGNPQMPHLGQS